MVRRVKKWNRCTLDTVEYLIPGILKAKLDKYLPRLSQTQIILTQGDGVDRFLTSLAVVLLHFYDM